MRAWFPCPSLFRLFVRQRLHSAERKTRVVSARLCSAHYRCHVRGQRIYLHTCLAGHGQWHQARIDTGASTTAELLETRREGATLPVVIHHAPLVYHPVGDSNTSRLACGRVGGVHSQTGRVQTRVLAVEEVGSGPRGVWAAALSFRYWHNRCFFGLAAGASAVADPEVDKIAHRRSALVAKQLHSGIGGIACHHTCTFVLDQRLRGVVCTGPNPTTVYTISVVIEVNIVGWCGCVTAVLGRAAVISATSACLRCAHYRKLEWAPAPPPAAHTCVWVGADIVCSAICTLHRSFLVKHCWRGRRLERQLVRDSFPVSDCSIVRTRGQEKWAE